MCTTTKREKNGVKYILMNCVSGAISTSSWTLLTLTQIYVHILTYSLFSLFIIYYKKLRAIKINKLLFFQFTFIISNLHYLFGCANFTSQHFFQMEQQKYSLKFIFSLTLVFPYKQQTFFKDFFYSLPKISSFSYLYFLVSFKKS